MPTHRVSGGFDLRHDVVGEVEVSFRVLHALGDVEVRVCRKQPIDDHVFDCFCYIMNQCMGMVLGLNKDRRTGLVIVNDLVQLEAHGTDLVNLIRVLDIVAYLVIEDTGRLNYPV
jgi:hypothetical protein